MKIYLSLTFVCLLFCSCETASVNLGSATNFFPSNTQLNEGIAMKYYEHNNPTNKDASFSINIAYRTIQFFQPNTLVMDFYDAAMRLQEHSIFEVNDNQFKLIEKYYYTRGDTIQAEMTDNVMFDWGNEKALSKYKLSSNGYQSIFITINTH